jgi:hypothetical protein
VRPGENTPGLYDAAQVSYLTVWLFESDWAVVFARLFWTSSTGKKETATGCEIGEGSAFSKSLGDSSPENDWEHNSLHSRVIPFHQDVLIR